MTNKDPLHLTSTGLPRTPLNNPEKYLSRSEKSALLSIEFLSQTNQEQREELSHILALYQEDRKERCSVHRKTDKKRQKKTNHQLFLGLNFLKTNFCPEKKEHQEMVIDWNDDLIKNGIKTRTTSGTKRRARKPLSESAFNNREILCRNFLEFVAFENKHSFSNDIKEQAKLLFSDLLMNKSKQNGHNKN
jgi:hypothetical protein